MNQDVKALPVVAWADDLTKPQPHCVTDLRYRSAADADSGKAYTPVVRQSDAESALAELRDKLDRLTQAFNAMTVKKIEADDAGAELRAEVERLRTDGARAVRWAPSSAHWSEVLRELFGPDAREGINALEARLREERQRADTAEARLERARGLLQGAEVLFAPLCKDATAWTWLDGARAFLGEGNG